MKSIMYHTWEPGLEGNLKTSGGGAVWTRYLWRFFNKNGYSIQYFSKDDLGPLNNPEWKPAIMPDVAIFCWRWMLPDVPQYRERNEIYRRQNALIAWCIKHNVPFFIHDQDLKMSGRERDYITYNQGKIATPSFNPEHGELSLHFPNPYKFRSLTENHHDELVYIGNNYERMEQTVRMLAPFSKRVKTKLWGNWLEAGPGRDPEEVQRLLPDVQFMGRLNQSQVVRKLAMKKATIMLHKEEYGPRGFTTIRWAEAATAGTLTFIPKEFHLPYPYNTLLKYLRVSDGTEMLSRYAMVRKEDEFIIINNVRRLVNEYMKPEPWLRLVERIIDEQKQLLSS